ncbi:MAG: hypothetical protein ACR2NN_09060 [Bryobacteraceae bacterium]
MRNVLLFLIAAAMLFGADDPWTKVRELKSGTELRVYKKGASKPILAKADEATDDKLVVVVKNEQVAIAKEDIDRIEARPVRTGSRVTKETRKTTTDAVIEPGTAARPRQATVPGTSSSTNVSIGSKPDFETIYRRTSVAPPK